MNTNSNTYTVIYSTVLVVVVAAVLAFAAMYLKPKQDDNIKKDTVSQILTAAGIETTEDSDILQIYADSIEKAILVKMDGEVAKALNTTAKECVVYGTSDLKKQTVAADADKLLPVYIFKNGTTVIPCYGAGLWGPIWGYIGLDNDLNTIKKACFGHKGETPGLGAKITDEPAVFADKFTSKVIGAGEIKFEVAKNVDADAASAVNAISGATITSQSVGKAVNQWLGFYQEYFNKNGVKTECEQPETQDAPVLTDSAEAEDTAPEAEAETETPAETVNE